MQFTITLIIVIITALVSLGGFSNQKVMDDLIFSAPEIKRGQWYRFITHGLLHGDIFHLLFNMYALYSFGTSVERVFGDVCVFGSNGKWVYLLLYVTALVVASIPDYMKHKNNYGFRSLGASGAVSAVIFSSIVILPTIGIGIAFVPGISIPGYLFGLIYLAISAYLDRRGGGNVNHGAHFWGAVYGLVFTFAFLNLLSHIDVIQNIKDQLKAGAPFLPNCGL